jgi:hypothetical protein
MYNLLFFLVNTVFYKYILINEIKLKLIYNIKNIKKNITKKSYKIRFYS